LALAAFLLMFAAADACIAQVPTVASAVSSAPTVQETEAAPHQSETKAQRDARLKWWREGKFGMFVHWGISV